LRYWRCNNLLRDEDGNIISDNITYVNAELENQDPILEDIETILNDYCPNVDVAYTITSGNRWIFLLYEGNATLQDLERMQNAYEKSILAAS
jgi:hypothetical protein